MRCPYCESGTNDFVPMNQAVEYSGIEMAVNRQGMLRVRVLDDDGGFTTQDIIEIRNCPLCGKRFMKGPRCGHHINIPSNGIAGYCPICDKEVPDMEKRTIRVKPSCFAPEFEMIIPIPTDRDDEEYIDELLDGILSTEFRYNAEWDFVDGLS